MRFLSQNPSSSSCTIFYLVIVVLVHFHKHGDAALILPGNEKVPAVFVFGDSIMDPGNNNDVKTMIKSNFPPYGRDFPGGIPTGRFSNGKIPSDIIAEKLGIKDLLPAYLDPNLKPEDLVTGVSFASSGAGYDPLTSNISATMSLSDQLRLFKESLTKIEATVGREQTATILSKSLFLVCAGSYDIAHTYYGTPDRKAQYDVNAYTDLLIGEASNFFQELYNVGARRIGIFSVLLVGCAPVQRTLTGGVQKKCSEPINQACLQLNGKLVNLVDTLKQHHPDAKFVYLDIYSPVLSILQKPAQYGIEVYKDGCCATGDLNVSVLCTNNLNDPLTCKDATKFVFWDSYHPTASAYQVITSTALKRNINKFFLP